jgi:hypothetical protein
MDRHYAAHSRFSKFCERATRLEIKAEEVEEKDDTNTECLHKNGAVSKIY